MSLSILPDYIHRMAEIAARPIDWHDADLHTQELVTQAMRTHSKTPLLPVIAHRLYQECFRSIAMGKFDRAAFLISMAHLKPNRLNLASEQLFAAFNPISIRPFE